MSNIMVFAFSIDICIVFVYTDRASEYSVWVPADAVTAPQENREPGENPGRYRHCMRGGSAFGESRSLGQPEKAMQNWRGASQENCLNVGTQGSASTEPVIFCCGKTAAAARCRVAVAFCFSAHQLNITDTIGSGDPVRNRNNRPLLCWAYALSQRA